MRLNSTLRILENFILLLIISSIIVAAANNPGHDTLYIEQQGDSSLNGTLNITQNLSVSKAIMLSNITLYGQGETTSTTYLSADGSGNFFIDGQGDIKIKWNIPGDVVYIGQSTATPTDLNISGDLYVRGDSITLAGVSVCLYNGSNCPASLGGANLTGNAATAGYLAQWQNSSILNNSIIYQNGTNIGIGMTNPSDALTVYGGSGINTNITINTDNDNTARINLQRAGSTKAILYASGQSGQVGFKADTDFGFEIGFLSTLNEYVRITMPASGSVKIAGGRSGDSGVGNDFIVQGGITNDFQAGNLQLRGGDATGTGTNGNVVFQNAEGTADYMFINDTTGNIGIGMTSPTAKLHVNGSINVTAGNNICISGGNCLSSVSGADGNNYTDTIGFNRTGNTVQLNLNRTGMSNLTTTITMNDTTKALPGTCTGNNVVQNTTTTGVQCVPVLTGSTESDPVWAANYTAKTGSGNIVYNNTPTITSPTILTGITLPDDSVAEADINFATTCGSTSKLYINSGDLACGTDANTGNCSADQSCPLILYDTNATNFYNSSNPLNFINSTYGNSTYPLRSTWTTIDNYPSYCSANNYMTGINDTLQCYTINGANITNSLNWINSTYGNSTYQTGTEAVNYTTSISFNKTGSTLQLNLAQTGTTNLTSTVTMNDTTKALPGTCTGSNFVQNTTTSGVQCATPTATGDGNNYTSSIGYSGTTQATLNLAITGRSNLTAAIPDNYLYNTGDTATGNYTFGSTALHIDDTNDRVGIGTAAPGSRLDVSGGDILLSNNQFLRQLNSGGGAYNVIGYSSSDLLQIGNSGAGGPSDSIVFYTTVGERMRITSTGSIGIGTNSPAAKLHINGTGNLLNISNGSLSVLYVNDTDINIIGNVEDLLSNSSPIKLFSNPSTGGSDALFVSYPYAYTFNDDQNLTIWDISNPASPTKIGYTFSNGSRSIYVAGKYLYGMSYTSTWFEIFDIGDPANPVRIYANQTGGAANPNGIVASGKYVYMQQLYNGLKIWDVSNPYSPVLMNTAKVADVGYPQLDVQGKYAYSAGRTDSCTSDNSGKLTITDITNASSPVDMNTTNPGTGACLTSIDVDGGYAYITDYGLNKTHIYNISNASRPQVVAAISHSSSPDTARVSGRYLFVNTASNLEAYDITNPASPVLVGLSPTTSAGNRIFISGPYLYLIYRYSNLRLYKIPGIETASLRAHSADVGTLTVFGDAHIGDKLNVRTGLTVGSSGILSQGDVGVQKDLVVQGNVGIGTTSPTQKLDVNGSIKLMATASFTCDSTSAGAIYYNSTTNKHYGCNSTAWNALY